MQWLPDNRDKVRLNRLYTAYRLREHDYNRLLHTQQNKCAICLEEFSKEKPARVDHDHVTGKVRGLLCNKCNVDLGTYEKFSRFDTVQAYLREGMMDSTKGDLRPSPEQA